MRPRGAMRFGVLHGRRCAALADALDIPAPFAMGRFCVALERQLNRTVRVVRFPSGRPYRAGCGWQRPVPTTSTTTAKRRRRTRLT